MSNFIIVLISCLIALCISLYSVPVVVSLAHLLKIFDYPNDRSSSKRAIPTLGGIAIFISFVFSSICGLMFIEFSELIFIFGAAMLMFFIGLKDDITTISPSKKLIAQIIAACFIIFPAQIRFTNLHGFFGIWEIGAFHSIILTFMAIVFIINAFNLMDGIDGLAAGLSIMSSVVFGSWFLISGHLSYALLSFSLTGSILGFFYYNVYGKKNRIFMGDTGSLVIGTVMSVILIKFNEFNIDQSLPYSIASAPVVSFVILIYPLADAFRVFIIRIMQSKSPFAADKNHLHHRLLTLGFSHKRATYSIILINILLIIPVLAFNTVGAGRLAGFIVLTSTSLFMIPAYIIRKKHLIDKDDPYQKLLLPGLPGHVKN